MWWFRAALCLALAALAGCGFRPLYGESGGREVRAELARVEVAPIAGALGPELAESLEQALAPRGRGDGGARFHLGVALSQGSTPLITERDTKVRRYDFLLSARYTLSEAGTGTVLESGEVRSVTSYNVIESADYATLVAEQSAGRQAAREVSREIIDRLSLYFHGTRGR